MTEGDFVNGNERQFFTEPLNGDCDKDYSRRGPVGDEIRLGVRCRNGHVIEKVIKQHELDWAIVDADERAMGTELHYEAIMDIDCDVCQVGVRVIIGLWEYPEGMYNYCDVEVDNGDLIGGIDGNLIWSGFNNGRNNEKKEI